jgi:hypothetical protein
MNTEFAAALLGAGAGGIASFATTWGFTFHDRRRRRAALATALLVDLHAIDHLARAVYRSPRGAINGESTYPAFALAPDVLAEAFRPATVDLVMHMGRLVANLRRHVQPGPAVPEANGDLLAERLARGAQERVVIVRMATALMIVQLVARLKDRLEREGGRLEIQPLDRPQVIDPKAPPPLPPRAFPLRELRDDAPPEATELSMPA